MSIQPQKSIALAAALAVTSLTLLALADSHLPAARSADHEHPVLLPTVVVRPQASLVELQTITVRPNRAERIAAGLDASPDDDALIGNNQGASGLLNAGSSLPMPYYSFGKSARRTSKE